MNNLLWRRCRMQAVSNGYAGSHQASNFHGYLKVENNNDLLVNKYNDVIGTRKQFG